jgi:hypothetical protein
MSNVVEHERVSDTIRLPRPRVSPRARALADRLIHGADALIVMASGLTDAEWQTRLPGDGRTVGVVVHHVASVYPVEVQLAKTVAQGTAVSGLVPADIDTMNAAHALEHDKATKEETLALLRRNSAEAAVVIGGLSDEQLDRAVTVSLYANAPLTCQFVLEDHAVRHSYHHLARIRAALGR